MGQWDNSAPDGFRPEPPGGDGAREPGRGHGFTEPGSELNATLRGYDADAPAAEAAPQPVKETRLCQACGVVGTFVSGRCQNCGFMPVRREQGAEEAAAASAPAFEYAAQGDSGMLTKVLIGVLGLGLVAVIVFYLLPALTRKTPEAEPTAAPESATPEQAAAHAGALDAVVLDEAFHAGLAEQLEAGNQAWADSGLKAYVYRYSVIESLVPATSQDLTISCAIGGADKDRAAAQQEAFLAALKPWADALDARDGVGLRLSLSAEAGSGGAGESYIRYGREWGEEHKNLIDPVVAEIEKYKRDTGQYPLELSSDVSSAKTNGNPTFSAGGFGYLPLFRSEGGKIAMGSGKGLAAYMPAEISGYMLFAFLRDPGQGLDIWSAADINYYTEKISPFPYKPEAPVSNMPFTPDGKPDGVACVIKNGQLQ